MAKFLKSYWVNKIELPAIDLARLRYFIGQELSYYNALVSGFAGPIRSMSATFAATPQYEAILQTVAETGVSIRALKADKLSAAFKPFKDRLFDGTGKRLVDDRTQFLADIIASPGALERGVRRAMAMSVLRESRRHSKALTEETSSIIEMLSPIDAECKRHIQLPKSSIKVVEETKDELTLKLPYFETELTVPKPSASWNHAYVRYGHDGVVTLDLAFEEQDYVLRKLDRPPVKTGMKVTAAPIRRNF